MNVMMEYQTIGTFIKGIKIYKLTLENIPEYCSFSSAQYYPQNLSQGSGQVSVIDIHEGKDESIIKDKIKEVKKG